MLPAARFLFLLTMLAVAAVAAVPAQTEAFRSFYNLDYDKALEMFEQEVREHSDSPDAWNHLAQGLLYRRLFLDGALQSELVGRSNSFLRRPKVVMPPEEERRFLAAIEKSIELAGKRIGKDSHDAEALYALGVAHAHRGNYRLMCRKAYLDALRDANRSRNLHNRLRLVEPGNPDSFLVPAMHDYISGNLPVLVRILAAMTGLSGDRKRGIALMERAVREGKKTGVEARVLLAVIYNREGNGERAVPIMRELSEAFPRNYLYRSEEILLQARSGRREDALSALESIEKMKSANAPELALMDAAKVKRLREAVESLLKMRK